MCGQYHGLVPIPQHAYAPPALVRLGPVSALTLGAVGGSRMELGMGADMNTCFDNRTPGSMDTLC